MRKTKTHNVLRRLLAFVLIVSLLPLGYAGNVMAATTGTRNVSIQVTYGQTDARNVYGMINSMRRNLSDAWYWDANNYTKTYCNNLQPLTYDYALEQVAMKRAAEIALSYSHTRPNGTNYYTAYSENGVYAGVYAENIGVNYSSASALHNAMREDNANYSGQEQRRNMLNSQFTAVGIGHVYYNGYHYWVEEFANTVTRTSYTTPNNQTTTVNNIQIAESNITSDQIVVPSSIGNYIQMSAGQTIDLSGCYENIKVSNHWPSNANCPIVQGLNMYVSNTAVAYISGTKLIANTAGSTTLTLNRPDGRIPLQIPVQVTGTNNSSNTYSYYIPNASVGTIVDQTYTRYDIRPSVSVWLNGGYLYEGRDYTLTYSNNRNIGTASVTINGIGNYYGSRTVYFRIVNHGNGNTTVSSNNLANAVISKIAAQRYTGSSVKPEVTVTLNNIVLKEGSDYYLNYSDNGAPGKAAVMVVGTGNYTGSAKTSFIIKPEKPVITRLRAHGSKVRITWLPGTSVTGYEIYRSKGAYDYGYKKIAATKDGEMQSYTRAKLTKGTYYYKIRSYVTVDGTKYYSPYSSVKSVKIRR